VLPVLKQSASDGPCDAGPRRWRGQRAYASAGETRAPGPDVGCWAGRSACPWPRHTLLVASCVASARHTGTPLCLPHATHSVSSVNFCVLLVTGAVSGREPVAAVSPTFGRLFEGTDAGSPGQTLALSLPAVPCRAGPDRLGKRPIIHTGHTRHGRSGGAYFYSIHLGERSSRPPGNLLTCLPAPFRDWSGSRP
jgi:hypothetical protein